MKKIVQNMLGKMARAVLWRRAPFVIGITGSIGKTTTKDALYTILVTHTRVRTNIKNYNNEFGVPLTIIGAPSGGKNPFAWLRVFVVWLWDMTFAWRYPQVLVLELGIDHVGDMDYLVDMVRPQMGVVTVVEGVHAEKFGSIATIAREKGVLIKRLPASGSAILNSDDARVAKMAQHTKAHVQMYSATGDADAQISAGEVSFAGRGGVTFKVREGQVTVPVRLPHIIAPQMVPSIMAAITAARAYGMNLADIAQALTQLTPPHGRMNLLYTSDNITLIDDSYNAAPASVRAALGVLGTFPTEGRRVAVLGDMRELGAVEEYEHRALAAEIITHKIDVVVSVGGQMRFLHEQLGAACKEHYQICAPYHYKTTSEAVAAIRTLVTPGDTVLVKGSNGMEMWHVTEELQK